MLRRETSVALVLLLGLVLLLFTLLGSVHFARIYRVWASARFNFLFEWNRFHRDIVYPKRMSGKAFCRFAYTTCFIFNNLF
jgi:hypothetical protein